MEGLIIVFAIIGVIESLIAIFINEKNEKAYNVLLGSGLTLFVVSVICIVLIKTETKIEPIEVYRGNTTLQITYQDSVPIDSVVIFKNK